MFRLACAQLEPRVGDTEHNLRITRDAIRSAAAAAAEMVVLPELAASGYMFESAAEARSLAERPDGPTLSAWAAEAGAGTVVVGGFAELGDGGEIFNSIAVVDATGVLAVYRKTHLWDREKLVFAPGDAPPPVVTVRSVRLGLLVCYDLEFPELVRDLVVGGADVLVAPANWPLYPRPEGERPGEVVTCMAHARMNRVFFAACDRIGIERGQAFTGASVITDEWGWPLAEAPVGEPALLIAEIDPGRARDKRWTDRADVLGDRRPELYGQVTGAS